MGVSRMIIFGLALVGITLELTQILKCTLHFPDPTEVYSFLKDYLNPKGHGRRSMPVLVHPKFPRITLGFHKPTMVLRYIQFDYFIDIKSGRHVGTRTSKVIITLYVCFLFCSLSHDKPA